MKTSCKIIEDLLPLYADEVCSEESRALVEEHLEECPACREKLTILKDTTDIKGDIRPLKNVGKWLEKLRLKALIKGILNGVIFTAVLVFGYFFLTQMRIMKVPAEHVIVSDVCELSDGNIAFHLYIDDSYDLNAVEETRDSNGNMYITPKRTVIQKRRLDGFYSGLFNTYYAIGIQTDKSETGDTMLDFSFDAGEEPNAIYLRLRGEDILIWEKGMKLPAASEEVEERFSSPNREGNG